MMFGCEEERWRSQVRSMIQFSQQINPSWCLAMRTGKEGRVKDGFEKDCEAQEGWILKGGVPNACSIGLLWIWDSKFLTRGPYEEDSQ